MYRSYENPHKLEQQLKELREEYNERRKLGADAYELIDLAMEINELEERVNFAWQDDEYDCNYCD
jgi:hypothetical protein